MNKYPVDNSFMTFYVCFISVVITCCLMVPSYAENTVHGTLRNPTLVCSTAHLVVPAISEIPINTFISEIHDETAQQLLQSWKASHGVIRSTPEGISWQIINAAPGEHHVTLHFKLPSSGIQSCTIRVFVSANATAVGNKGRTQQRSVSRETGIGLLVKGQQERPGYGLYTYILLANEPDEQNRDKYLQLIQSFLEMVPEITELQFYIPPSELNIAYLPVKRLPDREYSKTELAGFILKHYDYGRARHILRTLPGDHRHGPYILSVKKPATGKTAPAPPFITQDLTHFPTDLLRRVIAEFLIQAAQERFEQTRTLPQLALRMQLIINLTARATPDILKAIQQWIEVYS